MTVVITKFVLSVLRAVSQLLSGAVAYYAVEILCDYFAFREGVNPQVARVSLVLFFPFLAILSFVLLTVAWHKLPSDQPRTRYPEVLMVIGASILMPVYFEIASYLIYNPRPILLSEVRKDLFWMYVLFPLTVMDIGTYNLSLHVLALSAVSALLTGYLLRKKANPAIVPLKPVKIMITLV